MTGNHYEPLLWSILIGSTRIPGLHYNWLNDQPPSYCHLSQTRIGIKHLYISFWKWTKMMYIIPIIIIINIYIYISYYWIILDFLLIVITGDGWWGTKHHNGHILQKCGLWDCRSHTLQAARWAPQLSWTFFASPVPEISGGESSDSHREEMHKKCS